METSGKTLDTLKKAGWYPNRRIDTEDIQELLTSRGFKIYEPVKLFLEEFGELQIQVVSEKMKGKLVQHHTYTKRLIHEHYRYRGVSESERNAGEMMIAVGEISDGNFDLLISETGKMYCSMGKLGDTVWEGWERLIMEKGFMLWGSY